MNISLFFVAFHCVCNIIIERKHFSFKNNMNRFEIKRNLTCNSTNVIYVIECDSCQENYIGCAKTLNLRVSQHKSNIKIPENRRLHVSNHLYQCSQGNFKIMPIYQVDKYSMLTTKEEFFINKFKPSLNRT